MTSSGAIVTIVRRSSQLPGASSIDAAPVFENKTDITQILSNPCPTGLFEQLTGEQTESRRTFAGDCGLNFLLPASLSHGRTLRQ